MMKPEEWRAAEAEAEKAEHPRGWKYRTDTRRMVRTLDEQHAALEEIARLVKRFEL